eukprot:GILK01012597.1.p1 GENE.GILK01012597.1~~GILK01012597.1.p1  ORF type:complete len:203 (-),score=5.92 GILK01012597.1:133-741(-)
MADQEVEAIRRCQRWTRDAFQNDSQLRFLVQALQTSGCEIPDGFVRCIPCKQKAAGGFVPASEKHPRMVVLCADRLKFKSLVRSTLIHEFIHYFDMCSRKMDFTDCRQHACSEIRAANLSYDCNLTMELRRGNFQLRGAREACVRRRAKLAVQFNPNCRTPVTPDGDTGGPGSAAAATVIDAVDAVWHACYEDRSPFNDSNS